MEGLFVLRDRQEEVRMTMDGDGYVQVIFNDFFFSYEIGSKINDWV